MGCAKSLQSGQRVMFLTVNGIELHYEMLGDWHAVALDARLPGMRC